MKYIFFLLLLTHAFLHFIGFSKAFDLREFASIDNIPTAQGIAWGLCALLFALAAGGSMLEKKWWPFMSSVAVIISQALIFKHWQDAAWGSLVNLLVLVVAGIHIADFRFQRIGRKKAKALLSAERVVSNHIITTDTIRHLPVAVQSWLINSGVVGKQQWLLTRLQQIGKMKTHPAATWLPFRATQYIAGSEPGYVWNVKVWWWPFIFVSGRDQLSNGKGSMQMKLLSLWDILSIRDDSKINSSSLIRWLAEICWSPAMALSPAITWQAIDTKTVQAVAKAAGCRETAVFYFTAHGDVGKVIAYRYKQQKNEFSLQTWQVEMLAYKSFNGIRIPYRCRVTWKLPDGDFTWLELEVTNISYNNLQLYSS